ncbi:hypothetical protein [Paenibacillus caui]|uniref:hypothetical protein n=1 Tax=Paenibacillus caui TaxID=2873927 RepID=UPI001CA7E1FC|nr:hypothetical protein [Paenibacillus caui]
MSKEEAKPERSVKSRLFTPEGKPVRVLSTSLGIALLANAFFVPGSAVSATSSDSADEPKLVAWSTEEVKAYFDKNVDWSIPLPASDEEDQGEQAGTEGGGSGSVSDPSSTSSGGTTVVNNYGYGGSGFGWDDLLLYHLLFNSGSNYSSSSWHKEHRGYYTGTKTPYQPRSYSSGSFQNKPVAGSTVRPKTSTSSTGTIVRRSTSSKAGGIGGNSSSLSSSSSKSSSGSISRSSSSYSSSKGGFGG